MMSLLSPKVKKLATTETDTGTAVALQIQAATNSSASGSRTDSSHHIAQSGSIHDHAESSSTPERKLHQQAHRVIPLGRDRSGFDKSQTETLKAFREQLYEEDILHDEDSIGEDDETLLRFLRARKFDIVQAKKMFADCQQWRKRVDGVGLDDLYKRIDPFDYPEREAVFDCWPMWFHKTDKKGRPLNVHFFGNMDLNRLYKSCTPERHWQTVIVNCESLTREVLPAASKHAGKNIGTTFVIVDLKGFGLNAFWQMKTLARAAFQISQDYYPETMGQLAIVNAPSTFTAIWNVMKPWMAKETVEKVDILGGDYKDVLLELVDAENLPASLGGKCTCADEGGCHLSGAGPWQDGRVGWGPKAEKKREMETKNDSGGVEGAEGVDEDDSSERESFYSAAEGV